MEKFDIKTATLADLYAAWQYCRDRAEVARKIEKDESWEESKLLMLLCVNIGDEILKRLTPSIEEIKKELSK